MVRTTYAWSVAGMALLLAASALHARPVHKQALADHFGPFLVKKLNDCRACHLPNADGEADDARAADKPHNPFGARLKEVRSELRKAGKKTTIADRLDAVGQEDSDRDGIANLIELLTGHHPGDPHDRPVVGELADAGLRLAAFRKLRGGYPWRPFEIVQRPAVPQVKNTKWVRNPIDAFIAVEHERLGLKPRPEAPRAVLLRRVYLDLVGLPPTPEELHAFLTDTAPDAYERVVDRLLVSAQHGERWGRHWMDVWRYSDWAGYGKQVRDSQPHIWRWRDWIVASLNADKGYDRMVLEMLAADELTPDNPDTLRATGYLVRNFKLLSRQKWMEDVVDHTAQAFLGVTLGCARCHDHMFDPILQKEYYQVRAIFEPHQVRIDQLPGQLGTAEDGLARAYDAKLDAQTFLFIRGDDRQPDKTPLAPGVPDTLGGRFPEIKPVSLPLAAYAPHKREFVYAAALNPARTKLEALQEPLRKTNNAARHLLVGTGQAISVQPFPALVGFVAMPWRTLEFVNTGIQLWLQEARALATIKEIEAERLEDTGQKDTEAWRRAATLAGQTQRRVAVLQALNNVRIAWNAHEAALRPNQPEKARKEAAGKLRQAQQVLTDAENTARLLDGRPYTKRPAPVYPTTSTGRRLAFARWIADRENPLTARVAMNHVWLRHLGQAIVPSVFDFGRNGRPPSHPALLDWLAAEFMDQGWSMKAMHRLIVTSSTYRQASTPDSDNLAIDRDNTFFWRMLPRRVEAEVVRDCVFHVAGQLDTTMGGPDIDQKFGLTTPRRSIYFRHAIEKQMEFLKLFDCAAVTECYQRKESILPQQALALANSELTLTNARLLARTLADRTASDPDAFTVAAFEHVLVRAPTPGELAECTAYLSQQTRRYSERKPNTPTTDPALRARASLVHVLINHHDFVTIR